MIKSNELRLGNWVYSTDGAKNQITIEALQYIQSHEGWHQVTPIGLNEEILMKSGFNKHVEGAVRYGLGKFKLISRKKDSFVMESICVPEHDIEIKHLHQLQNLYYALTGEELTINL